MKSFSLFPAFFRPRDLVHKVQLCDLLAGQRLCLLTIVDDNGFIVTVLAVQRLWLLMMMDDSGLTVTVLVVQRLWFSWWWMIMDSHSLCWQCTGCGSHDGGWQWTHTHCVALQVSYWYSQLCCLKRIRKVITFSAETIHHFYVSHQSKESTEAGFKWRGYTREDYKVKARNRWDYFTNGVFGW